MDHGVEPFELRRLHPARVVVPHRLTCAGPVPHQPGHRVAASREERHQRAADQAARPGHRDPQALAVGVAGMSLEVARKQLVPVGEHPVQARPDQHRVHRGPKRAERRRVLDAVGEDARSGAVGLEAVQVDPACERSLDLFVGELSIGLVIAVPCHPAERERPAYPQHGARAVLDSPGALEHPGVLPRGRQPLEGARALMPGEHRLGRKRQVTGALDHGRGWHRRKAFLDCGDHADRSARAARAPPRRSAPAPRSVPPWVKYAHRMGQSQNEARAGARLPRPWARVSSRHRLSIRPFISTPESACPVASQVRRCSR